MEPHLFLSVLDWIVVGCWVAFTIVGLRLRRGRFFSWSMYLWSSRAFIFRHSAADVRLCDSVTDLGFTEDTHDLYWINLEAARSFLAASQDDPNDLEVVLVCTDSGWLQTDRIAAPIDPGPSGVEIDNFRETSRSSTLHRLDSLLSRASW